MCDDDDDAQNAGVEGEELELCGLPSALASTEVGQPPRDDERSFERGDEEDEEGEADNAQSQGNEEDRGSSKKRIRREKDPIAARNADEGGSIEPLREEDPLLVALQHPIEPAPTEEEEEEEEAKTSEQIAR
jgi:hypothetical protein